MFAGLRVVILLVLAMSYLSSPSPPDEEVEKARLKVGWLQKDAGGIESVLKLFL